MSIGRTLEKKIIVIKLMENQVFFVIVGNTSPKHDFHDYTHMSMLSNRIHLMPF